MEKDHCSRSWDRSTKPERADLFFVQRNVAWHNAAHPAVLTRVTRPPAFPRAALLIRRLAILARDKAARVSTSGLVDPTLGYPARGPASGRRRSGILMDVT